MKRFEIGQRIDKGGVVFEITGRTKKTVKFVEIQHAGRFNERRSEGIKKKTEPGQRPPAERKRNVRNGKSC